MTELTTKTTSALKWSALERFFTQSFQLAVTLLLARLLGPDAFGLVAMLTIFIAIANVFVDSGFTSALIRKIDRNENDYVTAFYYNIVVAGLCYMGLYVCAPYIAEFYQQSDLLLLLRTLGLTVLINGFILIPKVKLSIVMDFKTQAKISFISVLIGGSSAIVLAIKGYGVWALIAQTIINSSCNALLYNILAPWRPRAKSTMQSFRYLFGFGSKLLLSGLLEVAYNNLYQLIIAKKFTPDLVGQFTQANQLASVPSITLTGIIQRVTFPLFSQLQREPKKMADGYRLALKTAAIVIFPLIMGLGLVSKPLLTYILGSQWQAAANLLTILCIGYMLYPIHSINLNLLHVIGRSDLFLRVEVLKKIVGVAILLITLPYGVLAMTIGLCITSYAALLLNTYYTAKLTDISQWNQCKDIAPIWIAVISATVLAYTAGIPWQSHPWVQIAINLAVAIFSYLMYLLLAQKPLLIHLYKILHR